MTETVYPLSKISEFTFFPNDDPDQWHEEVKVARRGWTITPPELQWAVLAPGGRCLNHENEWEFEPQPSSRTDEFYGRCRFSLDDALRRAQEVVNAAPRK